MVPSPLFVCADPTVAALRHTFAKDNVFNRLTTTEGSHVLLNKDVHGGNTPVPRTRMAENLLTATALYAARFPALTD